MALSRIVCVLARNLPVQIERSSRPGAPLIVEHPTERGVVFAFSGELARAGLQAGLSIHQARQMAPLAVTVPPNELAYHAAHGAIEAALRAFSPAVETVSLGEFLADARGLDRAHGGERALAQAIGAAAQSASGLSVQVGLAAGKFVAQQAARAAPEGGVCVVPSGGEAACLAPLPLSALPNLNGEIRRRLLLFDLHTLGDLAALRKPAVLRQFGAEMASLFELARGHDPRPLDVDVPPLRLVRSLALAEGVRERSILLNVISRLTRQLSRALHRRGYHAEALKIALRLDDGARLERGQAAKPPTSDERRLGRLAAQTLGRMAIHRPVVNVAVSAYPLRSWHLGLHQRALAEAGVSARQTRLEEALQLIAHRFGQAVVRIAALLGPPVPLSIDVLLNGDGQPGRLLFGGGARVVLAVDEQWRDERQWWASPIRRDYFRVQLADGSLRNIFQDLVTGAWFLDRAWPLL